MSAEKTTSANLHVVAVNTASVPLPSPSPPPIPANHEEQEYLNLVRYIIEHGNKRGDRTGTGTMSVFSAQLRFNLREGFPILTTKAVHWKSVVEELLWMIRGSTNSKELSAKGVKIWDSNGSRAFLDKCGFKDREEGDLGPVYGFQWRHSGAVYTDCKANYKGQGVDQLADIIHQIKTNPTSRRIVMSAWNPSDIGKMALPPCHMSVQFYVANGELSCSMYQRSCDMGLGVPFNMASYALLTHMIAHVCGLRVGEFVHMLGDAHVYLNHIEPLRTQLLRIPTPFPQLRIARTVTSIDDFQASDLQLVNYQPQPAIRMEFSA